MNSAKNKAELWTIVAIISTGVSAGSLFAAAAANACAYATRSPELGVAVTIGDGISIAAAAVAGLSWWRAHKFAKQALKEANR